jgi:hypothetical protein
VFPLMSMNTPAAYRGALGAGVCRSGLWCAALGTSMGNSTHRSSAGGSCGCFPRRLPRHQRLNAGFVVAKSIEADLAGPLLLCRGGSRWFRL